MKITLLLVFVIAFTSCTKSKLPTPPPDTPEMAEARTALENTNNALIGSAWKISASQENGVDNTTICDAYDFSFAKNGTLTAVDGLVRLQGKWATAYVDGTVRVGFFFQGQQGTAPNMPIIGVVEGNWTITERSGQNIRMQEVVNKMDALCFTKK